MTSPLPLPDWVPWWVHLAVLLLGMLFALFFVLMPFSVIGVKGRLEAIDARLDEIQGEIRSLAMRLPEDAGPETDQGHRPHYGESRPPIPPAPYRDDEPPRSRPSAASRRSPPAADRTEPRLY